MAASFTHLSTRRIIVPHLRPASSSSRSTTAVSASAFDGAASPNHQLTWSRRFSRVASPRILHNSPARPSVPHPLPLSSLCSTPTFPRAFHTSAPNMTVHEITSKQQFFKVIEEHKYVVLDCWATWCGPCKAISPILEKLSEIPDNSDIHFIKLDVDELPDVAQELGIRAMPTFISFKNGNKEGDLVGANPAGLEKLIAGVKA